MGMFTTDVKDIQAEIMGIFEYLHNHPEVSMKEFHTTKFLRNKLESLGCRTRVFDDCPGVIAEIGEGSPVVGIRADMDALWQEVDGEFKANHSCGHDSHMTMALGALMLLKKQKTLPRGTIRFIFQPAEEIGQGAKKMIEKGVVDDIEFLYGVHVRPIQETENGRATPAILHGASNHISGTIIGEEAHAARPHLGTNAIEVAASLIHELAYIHIDPMIPHSVKMTKLHAGGESANIIPGQATFSLDLRAQTNEVMNILIKQVKSAVDSIAEFYKVKIDLTIPESLAAATVNPEAKMIMAEAISEVLGRDKLDEALVTTGGEDFHFYSVKRPHLKATMLGLGCGLTPGLHHPHMTFDRSAIFSGMQILATAVLKTMENGAGGGHTPLNTAIYVQS
ncbi:M20 peptidase aminoacylase family protein [Bacillus sp. FJAT-49736]|uniref:M20 peptidase aminoacylase family protein n=1 Tax=Bacillus sp. FJAT-49736 TaxID=2833582 RepID=UPI001BC994CA|nr:M20 peptidase aminoacylase family protein [Bacillus sp. FJAT-49736]MBS4174568.1 M20 peptidase aminoacylase family protein [Bacillus sp. FJAT-49736]